MTDVVSFILAIIVILLALAVFVFLVSTLVPAMRPVWVIQVKRKFGRHNPNQKED